VSHERGGAMVSAGSDRGAGEGDRGGAAGRSADSAAGCYRGRARSPRHASRRGGSGDGGRFLRGGSDAVRAAVQAGSGSAVGLAFVAGRCDRGGAGGSANDIAADPLHVLRPTCPSRSISAGGEPSVLRRTGSRPRAHVPFIASHIRDAHLCGDERPVACPADAWGIDRFNRPRYMLGRWPKYRSSAWCRSGIRRRGRTLPRRLVRACGSTGATDIGKGRGWRASGRRRRSMRCGVICGH